MNMEILEREVMALPLVERMRLAERMLASAESELDTDVNEAWEREIAQRIAHLDQGHSALHSKNDVFADIERQLGK